MEDRVRRIGVMYRQAPRELKIKIGMILGGEKMTNQAKLDLLVTERVLTDDEVVRVSQARDQEIIKEQYEKLKADGRLNQMAREFKNPTRQQEILEIIRRVEEM